MNVSVYKSFQDVPGEVRQQLSYPSQPNFLLSFDWFSLLFKTSLMESVTPRIYVAFDREGQTVGALFCGVARRGLVRRLLSLTNFYTLEYAPSLVRDAVDAPAITYQLIRHIAAERPRWHVIDFRLLSLGMLEAQYLSDNLSNMGFRAYPFFQFENWYLPAGGKTFETYFSERGSQLRNTVTRKQKKLEKGHNFEIKLIDHESHELGDVLRDFTAVYNRSWKRPEPFPDFIPTLITTCAALRILRLGVLYVDGKPAAGQLWLNTHKKAVIYKLAYDEEHRDLGVGSILSKAMFRVALDEDHVDEIDYGVGSDAYKKEWMSSVRPIAGIEAFNRKTFLGLLLVMRQTARLAFRALCRRTSDLLKRRQSTGGIDLVRKAASD